MNVAHPVTGAPILYGGRADLIGYHNDALFIVDEKTTKSLGEYWARQWDLRGQFLGYCFAARAYGIPVSGAIIRGIAIQKTQYSHMQVQVQFPKWQLLRWWEEANIKVERMVKCWEANRYSLSYAEACSSYGGCMFKEPFCSMEDPTLWLGDMPTRRWNPLHVDPTKD